MQDGWTPPHNTLNTLRPNLQSTKKLSCTYLPPFIAKERKRFRVRQKKCGKA
jgi:hypothetical protein